MLNFNTIRTRSEYEQLRLSFLSSTEEIILTAYIDGLGIPTIGLGMNLQDKNSRDYVLDAILGINNLDGEAAAIEESYRKRIADIASKTYPHTSAAELDLKSKLDQVMSERVLDSRINFSNKRSTFTFLNDQEVINTFNSLTDQIYEKRVDDWIGVIIPDSYERLALVSLSYNGGLGPNLKTAIQNNNRPEAWYEIRYNSNLDNEKTQDIIQGIAKRRYYESQVFGLYNDHDQNPNSAITNSEAESVFKTYSSHQGKIKAYDVKFGAQVAAANTIPNKIITVQNFNDATARARNYLVSSYAPESSIDEILINSDSNLISEELKTTKSNVLILGEGNVIYSLSTLSGQDQIISSNNDGIIKINSVELAGDALTKTSQINHQTENQKSNLRGSLPENDFTKESQPASKWTLSSYDLTRVENDLVITKAAVEPSTNADSITIKNFPFNSNQAAFGINLDRKIVGLSPEEIHQDEGVVGKVIATPSFGGSFFAPVKIANRFYDSSNIDAWFNYAIRTYDHRGNILSTQNLTFIPEYLLPPAPINLVFQQTSATIDCAKLDNGNVAFVYTVTSSSIAGNIMSGSSAAFLAIADKNGVLISNRAVDQTSFSTKIGDPDSPPSGFYVFGFVSKNGMIFFKADNKYFAARLDEHTLRQITLDDFKIYQDPKKDPLTTATLATGHKITVTNGLPVPKDERSFSIASPTYAEKTAGEIIPNYNIEGSYVTNPFQKKLVLSVSPEKKADIVVSPNPNSVTIINGFDGDTNANRLSLPVGLNSVKIDKVSSDQYSVTDLLAGKFTLSNSAPKENSLEDLPTTPLEKTLFAEEENKILRDNADAGKIFEIWNKAFLESSKTASKETHYLDKTWSNNHEQLKTDEENKILNLGQESSILLLPGKQAVVMFGVRNDNLTKHPENYFSQNQQLSGNDSSRQSPATTIIVIGAVLLGVAGLGLVARKYLNSARSDGRTALATEDLDEENNNLKTPNSKIKAIELSKMSRDEGVTTQA